MSFLKMSLHIFSTDFIVPKNHEQLKATVLGFQSLRILLTAQAVKSALKAASKMVQPLMLSGTYRFIYYSFVKSIIIFRSYLLTKSK